ncbi:MAG TPA: YegS/Rv2252/BmrU family lipid kinase [Candidatus Baltobacteraceae bacterium]|nr:YegS/Rv2252/BmrU family lipid kinase [Candidatus Baltobacteraceae bacterium]
MRALLVLNERSRLGLREGPAVSRSLERCGIECVRDAQAPVQAVIAAGGDGTVIGTIPLALAREVPLGIVPLGTFNDLARTVGVPPAVERACEVIAGGRTRAIDLGCVNGTYFVNEASIGVSARIARRQTPQVKQRFGVFGVVSTTLQTLRDVRPFFAEIVHDGTAEQCRTVQITVANNARFGGVIERADAAIDDGWLDLYSVEPRNWLGAFALVRKIVLRDPSSGEGLRTRRSTRFEIRTHHPHHVSADGEPAGLTPAAFEVLPKALRLFVP